VSVTGWPPRITSLGPPGRDTNSDQDRARNKIRSALWPCPKQRMNLGLHDTCRRDRYRPRPTAKRTIELSDAHRLRKDFDGIEIAIGKERIAGVVAANGDRHAGSGKFMQQCHPAPARRASTLLAVLQIHVAHRQRDDRDTGSRHPSNCAFCVGGRPAGQAATVPRSDPSLPTEPNGGICNRFEPVGIGIVRLIRVEIEVEVAIPRQGKDTIQRLARIGVAKHHGAQNAVVRGDEIGEPLTLFCPVAFEHGKRDALQGNAARPSLPHSRQYGPTDCRLGAHRIDVRANGRGAMHECAAQ
jgi:hypothetical protein